MMSADRDPRAPASAPAGPSIRPRARRQTASAPAVRLHGDLQRDPYNRGFPLWTRPTMTGPVRERTRRRLHPHDRHGGRAGGEARRTCGPRAYLHIGHAKSICLNFGVARSSAAPATCASTTPTPPRKTSSTSSRSRKTSAGSASTGASRVLRVRLLRAALRVRRPADREGQGVRRQPDGRGDPRLPRHADRAGQGRARTAIGRSRRTSTCSRACAPASSRRRPRAAREDRHGVAEHQHARPGALPHPPRAPSPHRRRVVHLSDVRLRAPAVGRDRAHHALALHARVRGPPAALRLADREPAGPGAAAPDRVRAPEPHLHGDEQAQAARAGRGGARVRLGRSAHAHDRRACGAAATRRRRSATFCDRIGVAKRENVVDVALLEHAVREDLNRRARA